MNQEYTNGSLPDGKGASESPSRFQIRYLYYFLFILQNGLLLTGAILLTVRVWSFPPQSLTTDLVPVSTSIVLLIFFLGVLVLIWKKFYPFWGLKISLQPRGLHYARFRRMQNIYWEEIEDIFFGLRIGDQKNLLFTHCSVCLKSGAVIVLPGFLDNIDGLTRKILAGTYTMIHRKMIDEFKRGKEVDFKVFRISKEFLKYNLECIGTGELEDLELEETSSGLFKTGSSRFQLNILTRSGKSSRISFPVYQVANLIFFIYLFNNQFKGQPSMEIRYVRDSVNRELSTRLAINFRLEEKIFNLSRDVLTPEEKEILGAEPVPKKRRIMLWADPVSISSASAVYDPFGRGSFTILEEDVTWFKQVEPVAHNAFKAEKSGKYQEALKHYREALGFAPGSDLYLMGMGVCFLKLHKNREALLFLERASEINPNSERIKRNLYRVRKLLEK